MSKTIKHEREAPKVPRAVRNKIKRDNRKRTKAQVQHLAVIDDQLRDAQTVARRRKLVRISERVENKLYRIDHT